MKPDLELVQIRQNESFKVWTHGYPYHTVRWHFHPEYEIHLVTDTTGMYFVGDFIGKFAPGNLVMTGPNLPHNWVSDLPKDVVIERRCIVLQFSEEFITNLVAALPELHPFLDLLGDSRRGVLFSNDIADSARRLLCELLEARGATRIQLFMALIDLLIGASYRQGLASESYHPDPLGYMSANINRALVFIGDHLTDTFSEADLARFTKQSPSAFSRSFRRHTGFTFVQYVNRLRINVACQMLMSSEPARVTDICYGVGFSNISNFNRQFRAQKGMSPNEFRAYHARNLSVSALAQGKNNGTAASNARNLGG